MTTAQEALNALHDAYGFSDGDLGEALGVSREHINRLRNGAKQASVKLEDLAHALYNAQIDRQMNTARITSRRAPGSVVSTEPEIEEAFFLGFTKREVIIAGVVIGVVIVIAFALWYRAHRAPAIEEENR